ncbi:hypothetical protein ACOMHN_015876 [Nucella lapillus]
MREEMGCFKIGECVVFASREEDVLNDVRVHWAPLHMEDSYFTDYFESRGFKVVNHKLERDFKDRFYNGARLYRLMGPQKEWEDLSHVVNFPRFDFQVLLKVTGRMPLCLRCKKIGHQRSQCHEQNRASKFVHQQQLKQQETSVTQPPRRWESVEKKQLTVLSPAPPKQTQPQAPPRQTQPQAPPKQTQPQVEEEEEETVADMLVSSDEDDASLKTVEEMESSQDEVEVTEPSRKRLKSETSSVSPPVTVFTSNHHHSDSDSLKRNFLAVAILEGSPEEQGFSIQPAGETGFSRQPAGDRQSPDLSLMDRRRHPQGNYRRWMSGRALAGILHILTINDHVDLSQMPWMPSLRVIGTL